MKRYTIKPDTFAKDEYDGEEVVILDSYKEDKYHLVVTRDAKKSWLVLSEDLTEVEEVKELTNSAEYVKEITVKDPDSKGYVEMSVFKHNEGGGMFAVDSSYLDQCFDDDTDPVIQDPFNDGEKITLFGL